MADKCFHCGNYTHNDYLTFHNRTKALMGNCRKKKTLFAVYGRMHACKDFKPIVVKLPVTIPKLSLFSKIWREIKSWARVLKFQQ